MISTDQNYFTIYQKVTEDGRLKFKTKMVIGDEEGELGRDIIYKKFSVAPHFVENQIILYMTPDEDHRAALERNTVLQFFILDVLNDKIIDRELSFAIPEAIEIQTGMLIPSEMGVKDFQVLSWLPN